MQFIWTFHSLPELNHLDDDQKRGLIARCVDWRIRAKLFGRSLLVGLFFAGVAMGIIAQWTPWQFTLAAGSCVLAGAFVLWFQFEFLRIRSALRAHLKQALQGQRLPVCLSCGYNLTGTTGDRCSECGASVILPTTTSSGQRR